MHNDTNTYLKMGFIHLFLLFLSLVFSAGVLATQANIATDAVNPAENAQLLKQAEDAQTEKQITGSRKKAVPSEFTRVLWTDLIPQDDLAALLSPPDYLSSIVDGSPQDQIGASSSNSNDRYQQALVSTRVVEGMDGEAIKIPGFVVPIEFDDEQTITQFFLVPYFGACIHEPPPPPNQIIFVDYPKGLQLTELYDPFWISGVLKTSVIDNGLATAAYVMEMHHYEAYTEDE